MNNSKNSSKIFYYVLIAFVIILVIFSLSNTNTYSTKKYFNDAVQYFEQGEIESWYVVGNTKIVFKLTDEADSVVQASEFPKKYDFYIVYNAQEYRTLLDKSSDETYTNYYQTYVGSEQQSGSIWEYIFPVLAIGLALMFIYVMLKMFSTKSGGAMTFGKSRARSIVNIKVKFSDIAGADEEKEELREIVEFLKSPAKFTELGARIPKGVLLVGPPGTGKTLLARAVAGESEVPFLSISGSDFVEMFVGVGASRVRDLFDQAKRNSPCIIFIDEIDAVGRQRGAGLGGSNDEREQTLNQLLVELDGFEANQGIIVLAATNRSDILDPALLRPGRFDRQVYVNPPDVKGREGILKIHAKNKPLDNDIDFGTLARITSGFTGADIENMLNEAAILAAKAGRAKILMQDITEGINKVLMGPQKKSSIFTEKDKKITAYHESGHAIVSRKLENQEDIQEVSIIPRGMSGGHTLSIPTTNDRHVTLNKLNNMIAVLMGGRIAEEIIFDDIATGAENDIQRATEIARKMVTEWGMSKKFGFISFGSEGQVFIGRDYQSKNQYSEKIASEIDEEIRGILDANYKRAKKILTENTELLHQMSKLLIEKETIYKQEVDMLLEGKTVEEIIENMEKQEKIRKTREDKDKKEKEKLNKLRELEIKVKTSEVFLKHGIITEKEHKEILNMRNEYINKNKMKATESPQEKPKEEKPKEEKPKEKKSVPSKQSTKTKKSKEDKGEK